MEIPHYATLEDWKAARNKALVDLDVDLARTRFPNASSDDVLLVALHKTRLECIEIPEALRLESLEWLRAGGFKRMHGLDLPPPGELPT
jgi:hypothetical protein